MLMIFMDRAGTDGRQNALLIHGGFSRRKPPRIRPVVYATRGQLTRMNSASSTRTGNLDRAPGRRYAVVDSRRPMDTRPAGSFDNPRRNPDAIESGRHPPVCHRAFRPRRGGRRGDRDARQQTRRSSPDKLVSRDTEVCERLSANIRAPVQILVPQARSPSRLRTRFEVVRRRGRPKTEPLHVAASPRKAGVTLRKSSAAGRGGEGPRSGDGRCPTTGLS